MKRCPKQLGDGSVWHCAKPAGHKGAHCSELPPEPKEDAQRQLSAAEQKTGTGTVHTKISL